MRYRIVPRVLFETNFAMSISLRFRTLVTVCSLGGPWALAGFVSAQTMRVILPAAESDRAGQIITVAMPANGPKSVALRDAKGRISPIQREADGTGRFLVPEQRAGETLSFTLVSPDSVSGDQVVVRDANGVVEASTRNQPVLAYRKNRDMVPRPGINPDIIRAGYIHPVYSPAGKCVTDDYPPNHAWHHGIWTPWVKTAFQGRAPDFWNAEKKLGRHDFVAVDRAWSGSVHGGFVSQQQMIDLTAPSPLVVLKEVWEVTIYDIVASARPVRMFDLVVTQTNVTSDPLVLPKFHYGGFGFRGAAEWNGPGEAAHFLTSDGVTDRIKANDTRGKWCFVGGKIDGEMTGTAILGHPDNFRAPQPMRIHPTFPYMSFVPQQLGEFSIDPGKQYSARFRFVVADGPPDRGLIEAYWQ
jgi:hypothetical protein